MLAVVFGYNENNIWNCCFVWMCECEVNIKNVGLSHQKKEVIGEKRLWREAIELDDEMKLWDIV